MSTGFHVGFFVFITSVLLLLVSISRLTGSTAIADPSVLAAAIASMAGFILTLSITAGALWRRARALSVITALASVAVGSIFLLGPGIVPLLPALFPPAPPSISQPLTEAELAEPRRELRDGSRWVVQRALQFEMPEPPGLHPVDVPRDGRGVRALVSVPFSEHMAVWRWVDADESRNVLVGIEVTQLDREPARRDLVDDVIAELIRSVSGSHPGALVSDEHRAPLDRMVRFHHPADGWTALARVFGYEVDARFLAVLVVAITPDDPRSLRAIVRAARHAAPVGGVTMVAAAPGASGAAPTGARVAGPWPVTSAGAFDLLVDAQGTLVAWAEPEERGGAIRAVELGPEGEALGAPREVATSGGHVRELAIARSGDRTAITWITTDGRSGRVRGSIIAPAGDAAPAPVAIGDAPASGSPRGDLAIAPLPDGTFVVASRGAGARPEIALFELGGTRRQIAPIPLAAPCEKALLGAAATGEGAMLGLCAGDAGTEEWLVARLDGHGALAGPPERHALGCGSISVTRSGELRAVDRCAGSTRITALDGTSITIASADPVPCEGERPSLGVPLESVTGDLESMLPSSVAPAGARAAWTGEALLVATRLGPELVIQRRQCQAGALLRTDL